MSQTPVQRKTPVYQPLLEEMMGKIRNGGVGPGEKLGTEVELADSAGISRMSVRRAVEQLIDQGLVERRQGKGLYVRDPARSTRQIQVVVPSMSFDQCVQIAQGAQMFGSDRGVQAQVYDAHARMALDIELLRQLPDSPMRGAIIVSWHHPQFATALYELSRVNFPFVLVDEQLRDIDVPCVLVDNHAGGYKVGQELIAAGHQRIGFVGNFAADTVVARLEGLRDAVGDARLPFDRSLAVDIQLENPDEGWEQSIDQATRKLLESPEPPTAIFFCDDQTAAHGCRTIKAMGLTIPGDISVVGFDDNPFCEWLDPALSTVHQPGHKMGQAAMAMLLDRIANPTKPAERRVLPMRWVPRDSVGPARR